MFGKVKIEHLPEYLRKIEVFFPELVEVQSVSLDAVNSYYNANFLGYAVFHSWAGAIHMALSPNGKFNRNDYFAQVEEVVRNLQEVTQVCELGCGKGFNIEFIARNHHERSVVGIDLNERHILSAKKKFSDMANVEFLVDDFHKLSTLDGREFGLLFAVESLCHSIDLEGVLNAAYAKSASNARFMIYDGFRSETNNVDADLVRAMSLVERAMAVPRFRTESEFVKAAQHSGWSVRSIEDRSVDVMPNLIRLSDFAKGFFKIAPVGRIIKGVLPRFLVTNAVAGLLMPLTVSQGIHRYLAIELEKKP
ncbi:MAG: class I SAM-dependent methyltransferase [Gammaproteobacteria bacterium]|nr:class I SAM-dependent methyltransferase [Gammaproteobacteria bacterium]